MKYLLLVLFLTGCGTTGRVTNVIDFQDEIEGGNPITIVQIGKKFGKRHEVGFIHLSHIRSGRPFNSKEEDIIDGVYWTIEIWK